MYSYLAEQIEMYDVYTPLSMQTHCIFCIIATIVYFIQCCRKGSAHYILLAAAVDVTLITQFWTSAIVIISLGTIEAVLLISALVIRMRHIRDERKRNAEIIKAEKRKRQREILMQKKENDKSRKIIDNAFDD